MHTISDTVNRKIIDQVDISNLEIETDTGWYPISKIIKTAPYQVWELHTESGMWLECADDHIVFDDNFNEIFVKDIRRGTYIQTIVGRDMVTCVQVLDRVENMFDVTVDSSDHRYFTSGILSHNTTIINALSYGIYGNALTNIKKDNLVNKTNGKNMLVTIEFEKDGNHYVIHRGRKPNVFKYIVDDREQETDDAQGDSRETQKEIEKLLGMSHDMFKHIVALNTYTEPFLSLKANDQRAIIEQLLGITILSEKAELLKELCKTTKDTIQTEEIKIKAMQDANVRIQEQIENLIRRQTTWNKKQNDDITGLQTAIDELSSLDIDAEIESHKELAAFNQRCKDISDINKAITRAESDLAKEDKTIKKQNDDITGLQTAIDELSSLDIDAEIESHKELAAFNQRCKDISDINKAITRAESDLAKEDTIATKIQQEIASLEANTCYACDQHFHDEKHEIVLSVKRASLSEAALGYLTTQTQLQELIDTKFSLGELGPKPAVFYPTSNDAIHHKSSIVNLTMQLELKRQTLTEVLANYQTVHSYLQELNNEKRTMGDIGVTPTVFYPNSDDAIHHKSTVANLIAQLNAKKSDIDPYGEQIYEMTETALIEIDFTSINDLTIVKEHQDFLLKLLTNKDSFIRKCIIDQNLSYLNSRLGYYIDKIGLPHTVRFQNDLTVEIQELGRELDFDNLSRGERNRLILSLSWAFRDVWEHLYQPINLLFIDELVDSGMDTNGVEGAMAILKNMARDHNKSIWLVSHKDELAGRVNHVFNVVKEHGFTTYTNAE